MKPTALEVLSRALGSESPADNGATCEFHPRVWWFCGTGKYFSQDRKLPFPAMVFMYHAGRWVAYYESQKGLNDKRKWQNESFGAQTTAGRKYGLQTVHDELYCLTESAIRI